MLSFEEQIVSDLVDDPHGGLVVLSAGLPLHSLVGALILLHHPSQGSLLILSASESQKSSICRSLLRNPNAAAPPAEIAGDLPSHHRTALYSGGAAQFVTSRVLVADLLTCRAPRGSIAGLVILNAHRLTETSAEAFAARLLLRHSPSATVRAFSDSPHAMAAGFAKAERTLKCLYLRKLHLWPRFHLDVSADLERMPPEVLDIRVPMTAAMRAIQAAALESMDACLKELKRTNKVDVDDLTLENGLFKSFDEIVRRQLDPIWHTLGRKTKQLVSDLRTLRKLVDYLVRYDAVTYLKYLDTLRVSEGVHSVWIFAKSSYKIFESAKKRVYHVVQADGVKVGAGDNRSPAKKMKKTSHIDKEKETLTSDHVDAAKAGPSSGGVLLEEVLEEAPKWKVLRDLLVEIEEERLAQEALPRDSCDGEDGTADSGIVLVACKDERSCLQLEDYIGKGRGQVMRKEWEQYLLGKAELHGLRKREKKKSHDPKGIGVMNGMLANGNEKNDTRSLSKLEDDVLLSAALEVSYLADEGTALGGTLEPHAAKSGPVKGKTKGRPRKTKSHTSLDRNGNKDGLSDATEKSSSIIEEDKGKFPSSTCPNKGTIRKHNQDPDDLKATDAKSLPPVQFYALERDQHIIDTWKPSVIIVYHPDIAFVREIELYRAENSSRKLKVYFLFYEDSTEVQKFEASIRRENGAFETLIRQKSLMMIPVDQDGRCIGLGASSSEPQPLELLNSLTRKAGGRAAVEKEMQVIVDMREFMSSLPNVLHLKGMRVVPVTLEVGDYVLSPEICVERKSIADLFQSFASGRLFHQAEAMSRHYKIPVLLIEFSQDRSFSFQSANDIGDDVSPTSILSKLSLLILHFPRLRLVWSRSVHATAEIFASLKTNQDEPDESRAMRIGIPSETDSIENDARAENYNTSAVEFLRRLPGVTDSNYRALMDGCGNLAELALLPVERLAELMGGQKPARTLKEFLDAKFPTLL